MKIVFLHVCTYGTADRDTYGTADPDRDMYGPADTDRTADMHIDRISNLSLVKKTDINRQKR